jgi:hypothetical protein
MAQYLISYLDGETEKVEAEKVNIDDGSQVYVFHLGDPLQGEPVALVPKANVRSIHRQDEQAVTG